MYASTRQCSGDKFRFQRTLRRAGAVRAVMPFSAVLQLNCVSVVNVDVAAFVQAESNRLNQHF